MRLGGLAVERVDGSTRVAATLGWTDESIGDHRLWFGAEPGLDVEASIDPFVPMAVSLATWYREPLSVEAPVSDDVAAAVTDAMSVMARFQRRLPTTIRFSGGRVDRGPRPGAATALCFSRGVDSSWILLEHDEGRLEPAAEVALIVEGVEHFADPVDAAAASAIATRVVRRFGLTPWRLRTNLFSLLVDDLGLFWPDHHGAALFGAGYLLRRELADLHIASAGATETFRTLVGSHPDLDPGFSVAGLTFHHVAPDVPRSERVARLAADGRPLEWLRVCWLDPTANCGRCRKCRETSALLDSVDALDRAALFPGPAPSAQDLRDGPPATEYEDDLAGALTDPDLAAAARCETGRGFGDADVAPGRLARIAQGRSATDRAAWVVAGPAGPVTAAAADRAREVWGPGTVLDPARHPGATLGRACIADRVIVAVDERGAVEPTLDLVHLALELGARPIVCVPPTEQPRWRAALRDRDGSLVVTTRDLGDDPREDAEVTTRLRAEVSSGATARRPGIDRS